MPKKAFPNRHLFVPMTTVVFSFRHFLLNKLAGVRGGFLGLLRQTCHLLRCCPCSIPQPRACRHLRYFIIHSNCLRFNLSARTYHRPIQVKIPVPSSAALQVCQRRVVNQQPSLQQPPFISKQYVVFSLCHGSAYLTVYLRGLFSLREAQKLDSSQRVQVFAIDGTKRCGSCHVVSQVNKTLVFPTNLFFSSVFQCKFGCLLYDISLFFSFVRSVPSLSTLIS